MTIDVPEVIETELTEGALLLPKWFQRLTAVCAVAIPIVIPVSMYSLEERAAKRDRIESVAFEISNDSMRGVATLRDTAMVVEDIIHLHDSGLSAQIDASGFKERFLTLRDEVRIKTVRTGAEINSHLLRFRDQIPAATLQGFADDAKIAVNRGIQPFGECLDQMLPLVLTGKSPKAVFDECNLPQLVDIYFQASIAVSEEAVMLGKHGRYNAERLKKGEE
ncbi:MAG: hypothetical protein HWE25_13840 [Alphaproteobacteria bacterium]|nr:hypothetical protein [Alphaproteobacteria bacterium]